MDGHFSFESVNYPSHFLRHGGSDAPEIVLAEDDNTDAFNDDASWIPQKSLASSDAGFSFEASTISGQFIGLEEGRIKLVGSDMAADASFNLV
jgi:hypothetical protein